MTKNKGRESPFHPLEDACAKGDQVLRVEFPDDVDLDDFELKEDEKPYREWCVPAALIEERATVTLMSDHELEEMGGGDLARLSRPALLDRGLNRSRKRGLVAPS